MQHRSPIINKMVLAFLLILLLAKVDGTCFRKKLERTVYIHAVYTPEPGKLVNVIPFGNAVLVPGTFGNALILDLKVTQGADYNSTTVGRQRGFAVDVRAGNVSTASQLSLVGYDGYMSVQGRLSPLLQKNVLTITGGSGNFESAFGRVIQRTVSVNGVNLIVEAQIEACVS